MDGADDDFPRGPQDPEETPDAGTRDSLDEDDLDIFGSDGAMHPDHPLLARAQAALRKQLLESKLKLEEQLREKAEELKVR